MNNYFIKAFKEVILVEGGYADNPYDSGGKTMYGITEAVAREYGYTGDMKYLSLDFAQYIYQKGYWEKMDLDLISVVSEKIAFKMFDISVNIGTYSAVTFLQRALNVLNLREAVYKDLNVDALTGPSTIGALKKHLKHRKSDSTLYKILNSMQGNHYFTLAERRMKDEEFVYGWFTHRIT
jgi:lysozyme family protein